MRDLANDATHANAVIFDPERDATQKMFVTQAVNGMEPTETMSDRQHDDEAQSSVAGHGRVDAHNSRAPTDQPSDAAHSSHVSDHKAHGTHSSPVSGNGHISSDAHGAAAELETLIAEIRRNHRERCFAMEQRKRVNLSLGAFIRTALGWSLNSPADERKAVATEAADLIETGEKLEKGQTTSVPHYWDAFADIVLASLEARKPWDRIEKRATKEMERLAKQLPVWSWAEGVKGFGDVSLATIIAETGNLSNYDNPAKVWKRMGVAVLDDIRQGGLPKNAPAELWIEHGYSRQRRSRLWNIGKALIKSNGTGRYRTIYLERKETEVRKAEAEGLTVAPAAKIPKGKAKLYRSHGHIDNRARRYMEKRLLRDLWEAWPNQELEPKTPVARRLGAAP